MEVRTAHTADLGPELLAAARALLDDVFAPEMTDEDWEHGLGGMHVVVLDGSGVVAHGSVVSRRMLHRGRALRTGYLEGVAVRADRRGEGHGATVFAELERLVRGGYDLGALAATDEAIGFYASRGWQVWRGALSALTPGGIVATPEEAGGVFVLPVGAADLDLDGELSCDWREGDVW